MISEVKYVCRQIGKVGGQRQTLRPRMGERAGGGGNGQSPALKYMALIYSICHSMPSNTIERVHKPNVKCKKCNTGTWVNLL